MQHSSTIQKKKLKKTKNDLPINYSQIIADAAKETSVTIDIDTPTNQDRNSLAEFVDRNYSLGRFGLKV